MHLGRQTEKFDDRGVKRPKCSYCESALAVCRFTCTYYIYALVELTDAVDSALASLGEIA